jgi:hypothetical protein
VSAVDIGIGANVGAEAPVVPLAAIATDGGATTEGDEGYVDATELKSEGLRDSAGSVASKAAANVVEEPFEERRLVGQAPHVYLKTRAKSRYSAEANERAARSNPQLMRTVTSLLGLTRPLCFS